MPRKNTKATEAPPWRNSAQIRGVKSQLTIAINLSENGAYAEVDLKTARNLLEICDQAIHTEEGHGL
jgi:hypothetical protein